MTPRLPPHQHAIDGFVAAYHQVVLKEGLSRLKKAYDPVEQEPERTNVRDRHLAVLSASILPAADRGLAALDLTPEDAHRLFQLFVPAKAGRFRDPAGRADYEQTSVNANRLALDHLRAALRDHTDLPLQIDLAQHSQCGLPLLNHLARELLVWSYVVDCLQVDPIEVMDMLAALVHGSASVANAPTADPGWEYVLRNMLTRITSDLQAPAQRPVELPGTVSTETAALPEPEDTLLGLEVILRDYISWSWDAEQAADNELGARLLRHIYHRKLLLRFAYTGCTYRYTHDPKVRAAVPLTDKREQRALLGAFLQGLGFELDDDADLASILGWLLKLEDKTQPLGEDFRDDLQETRDAFVIQRIRDKTLRLESQLVAILDALATEHPDLATSQRWAALQNGSPSDRLVDRELRSALDTDLADLLGRVGAWLDPTYVGELGEISEATLALALRLEELLEQLTEYRNWTVGGRAEQFGEKAPGWLQKYFTALCRANTGRNATYTMTPSEWTNATAALCETNDSALIAHYRSVWARLAAPDEPQAGGPTDALRAILAEMADALTPIPGFDARDNAT